MEPISVASTSTSHEPTSQTPTQLLLASLRSSFGTLEELEDVLLQILASLDAIPLSFNTPLRIGADLRSDEVLHVMPKIQHAILNNILPTWLIPLRDSDHEKLVKQFFCPVSGHTTHTKSIPGDSHHINKHCKIATSALPALLSHLHTLDPKDPGPAVVLAFSVSMLGDIISTYPIDLVYDVMFSTDVTVDPRTDHRRTQEWEDYVRATCSVPGRVANAVQGKSGVVFNDKLDYGKYFSNVCVSTEKILFHITQMRSTDTSLQLYNHLLLKLLNLGIFPSRPPSLPSQPSFFSTTLPIIRHRLHLASVATTTCNATSSQYSETWRAVIKSLPLTSQQTLLVSLFGALDCQVGRDTSAPARRVVGECAKVLRGVVGKLGQNEMDNGELWSAVSAIICGSGRTWDIGIVRVVVCWIADPQDSSVDEDALEKLLNATVALWTNSDSIRHSLLSQHRYTSSLFLIILASLPSSSSALNRLALSPPFVASISIYLGHLDLEVRRCGMLAAEVIAKRCGKKLEFDGWEGVSEGLEWARTMRGWQPDWMADGFQSVADVDVTTEKESESEEPLPYMSNSSKTQAASAHSPASSPDSDDDSLQGYDTPTSSRSPSPTPSELAEIEKDPTLRVGRPKPVPRPVYLAQLVGLLRAGGTDEAGAAEKMEAGLVHVEGLVRRKKGFGLELEENAVELTIVLAGLKDSYELEGFEEKKQGALNALVECCPHKTAMTLIEQFFTNQYSISQRFSMLTALALGARALAGLSIPPSRIAGGMNVAFPSKMLPPALHRRHATAEEQEHLQGDVQRIMRGITGATMQRSKEEVEEVIPEVARERRLRLGSARARVTEIVDSTLPARNATRARTTPQTTFAVVAAEHFIMPLVNHMWWHLRDVETRTRGRTGTGTGIILGSMVLAQYLGALAVLVHAARHAPAFLGVVVPGAVEIAMSLGQRGGEDAAVERGNSIEGTGEGELVAREAAVLTAALEVALVALDASNELDGGRTLGLEHTALLLSVGEWAGGVLAAVEGGRRVSGGGGTAEGRAGGAAAGIVVRVEKMIERWGRSMVGL